MRAVCLSLVFLLCSSLLFASISYKEEKVRELRLYKTSLDFSTREEVNRSVYRAAHRAKELYHDRKMKILELRKSLEPKVLPPSAPVLPEKKN